MKFSLIYTFGLALLFTSCVSNKRYTALENRLIEKERENKSLQSDYTALIGQHSRLKDTLLVQKFENILEIEKKESLNKELKEKDKIISNLESRMVNKDKTIEDLNNKNDNLIDANKRYSDITKSLIENLENQNLKVLNLALSLQKQDSLNVRSVHKTNREISEQKYKKALEKLGFVFN